MSRVPPTPVEVWFEDRWYPGTLRTCEVSPDGADCSGVVSWGGVECVQTSRVPAQRMRKVNGEPGCPAVHQDSICASG
jgi:hypothetical protein